MLARAVIDTDIWVAGICGPASSDSAELVDAFRVGEFEAVSSPMLVSELDGVLRRPVFDRSLGERRVDDLMSTLVPWLLLAEDIYDPPRTSPNRAGDLLAALARAGGARFVVTGDDQLATSFVRGLTIATAGEFMAALDVLAA